MNKTPELPTEIWDSIFFASNGGLTGSDKVVLSKSSPVFEAVLRGKLMEGCVTSLIPLVVSYLAKRDLLMLRHTCKGLKQKVEELEESRFGSSILASLDTRDDHRRWSELAGMIEKQGGQGTLGMWLSLAVEPDMVLENDKAAEFFRKCGHRIVNLKLRVAMNSAEGLRYRLLHYLKFCGKLRRIQLLPDILSKGIGDSHVIITGQLYNRVVFQRSPDPIDLPFLTELQICSRLLEMDEKGENRIEQYKLDWDLFFERIFCSRLGKLTKMEISETGYFRGFLSKLMPSPSCVTEFNTGFQSWFTVDILRVLQSKGAKLKKLTLRDRKGDLSGNKDDSKAELANYLQGAVTLRTLSLEFENRVSYFEDFPPLETEFNSSVRSLILRNVIFPDGKGLQNLGAFKCLRKLHLSYDRLGYDNAENYEFTPDANNIFDHVPNIRQISLNLFNKGTVYSINHQW